MITKEELFGMLQNDLCDYLNEEFISDDHSRMTFKYNDIVFKISAFKVNERFKIFDEDVESIEIILPL